MFGLEHTTRQVAQGSTCHGVVQGSIRLAPQLQVGPPARLVDLVRQQWRTVYGLHYRREVTFGEEAGRTKRWNLARVQAAIHNLELAWLTHAGHANLAQAHRHDAAHPDDALGLLVARPT